jgi:hypothetical protein
MDQCPELLIYVVEGLVQGIVVIGQKVFLINLMVLLVVRLNLGSCIAGSVTFKIVLVCGTILGREVLHLYGDSEISKLN